MQVQNLNRDNNFIQVQQRNNIDLQKDQQALTAPDEKALQTKADKLEISTEAKKLQNNEAQTMSTIKANMNSGFYNRPDVIKSTAAAIEKAYPADGNLSK